MIPGMIGPVAGQSGSVAGALLSVSESVTTATGTSISWPGSRAVGDVFVLFDAAMNENTSSNLPARTVPTGFTELAKQAQAYEIASPIWLSQSYVASYRVIDGSESGSISGMSATYAHKKLFRYRGFNRPILSVTPSTWLVEVAINPAPQNADGTVNNLAKVVFGSVVGYEIDFASTSPAFAATESQASDMTSVPLTDWRSRVGRTIYARNATQQLHTIDASGRSILSSGVLWFS